MPRSICSPRRATSAPACATSPPPSACARAPSTTTSPARTRCSTRCWPRTSTASSNGWRRSRASAADGRALLEQLAIATLDGFAEPREQKLFRILMSDGIRLAKVGRINLYERMSSGRERLHDLLRRLIREGWLRRADVERPGPGVLQPAVDVAAAARHRRRPADDPAAACVRPPARRRSSCGAPPRRPRGRRAVPSPRPPGRARTRRRRDHPGVPSCFVSPLRLFVAAAGRRGRGADATGDAAPPADAAAVAVSTVAVEQRRSPASSA